MDDRLQEIIVSEEHYEPETMRKMFSELEDIDFEQLLAIITIVKTNAVFEDFIIFEKVIRALNKVPVNFTRRQGSLVKWIWYAVAIITHLRPDQEFSDEVKEYVRFVSNEECIYIYPPEMGIPEGHVALEDIKKRATGGPFPLGESTEEIQAGKFLLIQRYVNDRVKKDKKGLKRLF